MSYSDVLLTKLICRKSRLDDYEKAAHKMKASVASLQRRIEEGESSIDQQKSILACVADEVDRKRNDLLRLREEETRIITRQNQIATQCDRLSDLAKKAKVEIRDIEKLCEARKAELCGRERDIQNANNILQKQEVEIRQSDEKLGQLVDKIKERQEHLLQLDAGVESKEGELAELRRVFELEHRSFSDLIEEKRQLFQPKRVILENLRREFKQLDVDMDRYKKEMSALEVLADDMCSLKQNLKKKKKEFKNVCFDLERTKAEVLLWNQEIDQKRLVVVEMEKTREEFDKERQRFTQVLTQILGRRVGLELDEFGKVFHEVEDKVRSKFRDLGRIERLIGEKKDELDRLSYNVEREKTNLREKREEGRAEKENVDLMRKEMESLHFEMEKAETKVGEIEMLVNIFIISLVSKIRLCRKTAEADQARKSTEMELRHSCRKLEDVRKELSFLQIDANEAKGKRGEFWNASIFYFEWLGF